MAINKKDLKLDALAYLYRSSYYMAIGDHKLSLIFFSKASKEFAELKKIKILYSKNTNLLEAEKILDLFNKIKTTSFS